MYIRDDRERQNRVQEQAGRHFVIFFAIVQHHVGESGYTDYGGEDNDHVTETTKTLGF